MRKTETYQLNQWEISDRVRMEDFNADNVQLEKILTEKFGRVEKLGGTNPTEGSYRLSGNFYLKGDAWNAWECVAVVADLHKTSFLPEDYMEIMLQLPGYTHSDKLPSVEGGSFAIVLFPSHKAENPTKGLVVGRGGGLFFLDQPYMDLQGVSAYVRNPTSNDILHSSDTIIRAPRWDVYGLK